MWNYVTGSLQIKISYSAQIRFSFPRTHCCWQYFVSDVKYLLNTTLMYSPEQAHLL